MPNTVYLGPFLGGLGEVKALANRGNRQYPRAL